MKIDKKGYITLTPKESEAIMDLLYTLGAMSGTLEEDFNEDCEKAQKFAERMFTLFEELISTLKEKKKNSYE